MNVAYRRISNEVVARAEPRATFSFCAAAPDTVRFRRRLQCQGVNLRDPLRLSMPDVGRVDVKFYAVAVRILEIE